MNSANYGTQSPQLKATLHFFCPLEISRLRVANRALTSGRYNDNAEVFEERHRKFLKEGVDVFFRRMSELECHEVWKRNIIFWKYSG